MTRRHTKPKLRLDMDLKDARQLCNRCWDLMPTVRSEAIAAEVKAVIDLIGGDTMDADSINNARRELFLKASESADINECERISIGFADIVGHMVEGWIRSEVLRRPGDRADLENNQRRSTNLATALIFHVRQAARADESNWNGRSVETVDVDVRTKISNILVDQLLDHKN